MKVGHNQDSLFVHVSSLVTKAEKGVLDPQVTGQPPWNGVKLGWAWSGAGETKSKQKMAISSGFAQRSIE